MLTSCSGEKSSKALILYYSQTGATEKVALELQRLTGADIERFDVQEAYTGNYDETVARCGEEIAAGFIATLIPLQSDLSQYDTIYLGYPVWYGTCARPIAALLDKVSFDGKKIIPFCTFGSGGIEASSRDLAKQLPNATILPGYGIRNARVQYVGEEVEPFLIENGYIEGTVEALPEFSEQVPVTDTEKAIFDEACGDYQFPLGVPSTFATRPLNNGTEYLFIVESFGGQATIPVRVIEGRRAEFLRVIR